MSFNISAAIDLVNRGKTLQLTENHLVECSYTARIRRLFSKGHHIQQVEAITAFIGSQFIKAKSPEEKAAYLQLADGFIRYHRNDRGAGKVVQVFDRIVAPHRSKVEFMHPVNCAKHQKWVSNGLPEEIYQKHPSFCMFLEQSGLVSQIKITRDTVREIDGEAALLVEGIWTKWSDLDASFEARYSRRYQEMFVVHKHTIDVYTYLDNGKGLQKHHPYISEDTPLSTLNEDDYQRVLEKAHLFVRPGEEDVSVEERQRLQAQRPFIVQLVSSYVPGPKTNFHELVIKQKHPCLRIIIGSDNTERNIRKGEVYEVGYGWQKKMLIPFVATQGRFRSPDVWEYKSCDERVVTNIAITAEEAHALQQYTLKYHRDEVNFGNSTAFHLVRQNCSSYVRNVMAVIGIKVPTEIGIADLIRQAAPDWLLQVAAFFKAVVKGCKRVFKWSISVLPQGLRRRVAWAARKLVNLVRRIIICVSALCSVPFHYVLGGGGGAGGHAFVAPDAPKKQLNPTLANWKSWLSFSVYKINLPGILQQWQRQQASTVVYTNPIRLSIVP